MSVRIWILGCVLGFVMPSSAVACPWGFAPITLRDSVDGALAVVLAEYLEGRAPRDENDSGNSTLLLLRSAAPLPSSIPMRIGQTITIPSALDLHPHDLILLAAFEGEDESEEETFTVSPDRKIGWHVVGRATPRLFEYLRRMPPESDSNIERHAYFLAHLDDRDIAVAEDAQLELDRLSTGEFVALGDRVSLEWLRGELAAYEPEDPERFGMLALLLGANGDADDARRLARWIRTPYEGGYRPGLDEAMTGYVLLTGPHGIEEMSRFVFARNEIQFNEAYALYQALTRIAEDLPERCAVADLARPLERMLDLPDMQDLAILKLAEWKQWSVQAQVIALGTATEERSVRRAAVKFLFDSANAHAAPSQPRREQAHNAYLSLLDTLPPRDRRYMREYVLDLDVDEEAVELIELIDLTNSTGSEPDLPKVFLIQLE